MLITSNARDFGRNEKEKTSMYFFGMSHTCNLAKIRKVIIHKVAF